MVTVYFYQEGRDLVTISARVPEVPRVGETLRLDLSALITDPRWSDESRLVWAAAHQAEMVVGKVTHDLRVGPDSTGGYVAEQAVVVTLRPVVAHDCIRTAATKW